MKPDIKMKIEETLNSLDGIQRAEVQPFFYTRLVGRLQQQESAWDRLGTILSRPVVIVAALMMVFVMNVFLVLNRENGGAVTTPVANETFTDNEYLIASSSSFEYENIDTQ